MQRNIVRTFAIITLAACLGCADRPSPEATLPPVSLPPTRTLALATATDHPNPPPTPSWWSSPAPTATVAPPLTAVHSPESTPPADDVLIPGETEAPVTVTPIGRLSNAMLGQEASVEGLIVAIESFSGGFKFTLEDPTGQIVLLMWQAVYADCWDGPGLNLGARVRAEGVLDEYGGELQIQPSWGGGVKAVEPAASWAEPRQIGSLSGGDEGQRVMIVGDVIRTAGGEDWVKVFVEDESGEVGVFIWRNVLDLIPDNCGLGTAGSRVRVVGTVTIYQSNLEIVPTLPYDVTVLEIPQECVAVLASPYAVGLESQLYAGAGLSPARNNVKEMPGQNTLSESGDSN